MQSESKKLGVGGIKNTKVRLESQGEVFANCNAR
jgi:hypothetical protein